MASPMPLLAPVTMAVRPASARSIRRQTFCVASQVNTASATSFHPLSMVSECPRPSNCWSSVIAAESRYCFSVDLVVTSGTV